MITEITAWVKGIVLVVLFATFLEFLLPASSMQRFIRVIMGLFIMLSILNPLIDILHNRWLPEQKTVFGTSSGDLPDIQRAVDQTVQNRTKVTQEIYRKDLARQIRAIVIAIDGVAEARVVVDTDETKSQGTLRSVMVYVQPGISKDDRRVAKISIGAQAADEKHPELTAALQGKIRRSIIELTGINDNQIIVQRLN